MACAAGAQAGQVGHMISCVLPMLNGSQASKGRMLHLLSLSPNKLTVLWIPSTLAYNRYKEICCEAKWHINVIVLTIERFL